MTPVIGKQEGCCGSRGSKQRSCTSDVHPCPQANVTRDATYYVNGSPVGARDIFVVRTARPPCCSPRACLMPRALQRACMCRGEQAGTYWEGVTMMGLTLQSPSQQAASLHVVSATCANDMGQHAVWCKSW